MIRHQRSRLTIGNTTSLSASGGDAEATCAEHRETSVSGEEAERSPARKRRKVNRNKMTARENAASALLVNVLEACNLLGGIHPRSLARLEKRGLIRSVGGLVERKLYATADLKSLVEDLRAWSPAGEEVAK